MLKWFYFPLLARIANTYLAFISLRHIYVFAISSTFWNLKALISITSLIQEEILQPPISANTLSSGHPHLQFHVNSKYSVIFYLQETLLTCRSSNHICLFFSCKKLKNASMLYKQEEKNLEGLTSVITSSITSDFKMKTSSWEIKPAGFSIQLSLLLNRVVILDPSLP